MKRKKTCALSVCWAGTVCEDVEDLCFVCWAGTLCEEVEDLCFVCLLGRNGL